MHLYLLRFVRKTSLYAQRQVMFHVHETLMEDRRIMAGIAIVEFTCRQVEHTEEERDEHILVVLFGQRLIESHHNMFCALFVRGHAAEQRTRHSHHESSWYTLSAHIADSEEQLIGAHIEIVQISTDLFSRFNHTIHVHIQSVEEWREDLRQHRHLNRTGNGQLTLDTLVLRTDSG